VKKKRQNHDLKKLREHASNSAHFFINIVCYFCW